jgi:hypothetical protein
MSFDFALEQVCTHEVWFETTTLDPFVRDTLRFSVPVSSSNVALYMNSAFVPRSGLFAPASVSVINDGSYNIKSGVNDLVYIKIGSSTPRIFQLPPGMTVTAKDVTLALQKQVPELNIFVKNNRVNFSARSSSMTDTFSFPDPTWSDKTGVIPTTSRILGGFRELGITPGRCLNPIQISPGWDLIADPNSDWGEKIILFNEPVKNSASVFQISYTTNAQYCRRCFGSKIEFDYRVLNGGYESVRDSDLLLQEFDKFLFTRSGSHWKWPWLGSHLNERIGGKNIVTDGTTNSFISMDVTQAFKTYQNIKNQQDSLQVQKVTDAEYPSDLSGMSVVTDPNDPTIALVTGSIVSRSRDKVELKRIIGNPDTGTSSLFRLRG